MATSVQRGSIFIITQSGLRFRPVVVYSSACPGDSGKESSEKYRAIAPHVVGSDLLDHKQTEHAFSLRIRVRGRYHCQLADDCLWAEALVCQFLMAPDRA